MEDFSGPEKQHFQKFTEFAENLDYYIFHIKFAVILGNTAIKILKHSRKVSISGNDTSRLK